MLLPVVLIFSAVVIRLISQPLVDELEEIDHILEMLKVDLIYNRER